MAGDWVEVDNYASQSEDRLSGTTKIKANDYSTSPYLTTDITQSWYGKYDEEVNSDGFNAAGIELYGSGADLKIETNAGKRRSKFRYIPNQIMDFDTWTIGPDPNDTPPAVLNLKIFASVGGLACSDTSGRQRDLGKEHVTVSLRVPEDGSEMAQTPGDWNRGDGAIFKGSSSYGSRLVAIPTNGNFEVWGPWVKYDATVEVDQWRLIPHYDEVTGSDDEYLPGEAILYLGYNAQVDNRSVQISSNLEDSYENGPSLSVDPITFRPGTPQPPNAGPYSVKIEPKSDGSKRAISAVEWNTFRENGNWYGDANFGVLLSGTFTNPQYSWGYSGDGEAFDRPFGGILSQSVDDPSSATIRLDFGGTDDLSDPNILATYNSFPKSSKVTVNVTDGADGAVAYKTYDVEWHLPIDNWSADGTQSSVYTLQPDVITGIGPGPSARKSYNPDLGQVQYAANAHVGSLIFDLGSTVAGAIPGAGGAVVSGLLSAGDLVLGTVQPPTPIEVENTWVKWVEAIATQTSINNGASGTQRLYPPSMADPSAGNDYHADPTSDDDYQNSTMSVTLLIQDKTLGFKGDGYDKHGYTGPANGSMTFPIRYDLNIFTSRLWGGQ